ncbi:MAG: heavy-metal-associated domain-containing protein [Gammaproteobacteria bacterium]|nr:heavy-metal-associated domain-containing protein [Gammaproteobacteria bacterium]
MHTATFTIQGMHCDGCARNIQRLVSALPGVHTAQVSFGKSTAQILYDPQAVTRAQLAQVIAGAGYTVTGGAD